MRVPYTTDDWNNCPNCGASFQGGPIPKKEREFFGGVTHYSTRVSVYDRESDREIGFMCPRCCKTWEHGLKQGKGLITAIADRSTSLHIASN